VCAGKTFICLVHLPLSVRPSNLRLLCLSVCLSVWAAQAALERLAFMNVGASVHACAAIEELLTNTQSLRELHLFNNMSDNEGAVSIAQAGQQTSQLASATLLFLGERMHQSGRKHGGKALAEKNFD
jgi:hypothetical protein